MSESRQSPAAEQGFITTLLCSLGIHSLILLLWLLWPTGQTVLPAHPLTVRIVAAAKTSPTPVVQRRPSASAPLRQVTVLPAPTPPDIPSPAQPETTKAAVPAAADNLPAETATFAPPQLAAAADESLAVSVPRDATANAVQDAYLQVLRQRIEERRNYPLPARKGRQEGRAIVRFRLDRQGRLCETWIAVPSGSSLLDRAALRAVTEAAPFPALPESIDAATTFDVPLTFRLER